VFVERSNNSAAREASEIKLQRCAIIPVIPGGTTPRFQAGMNVGA
jgi:hypothetical protein